MAWMEHGLQTSPTRYVVSMEEKMAAGAFGRATNYGCDGTPKKVYKGVYYVSGM